MTDIITKSIAVSHFPKRKEQSHKGDNGRVLILGGSLDYHGAPILSALGAQKSGADLVYIMVPECNFQITRATHPDFIVRTYAGDHFNVAAIPAVLALAKTCDAILIGPGMGESPETQEALDLLIPQLTIPTVLDSVAIMSVRRIHDFPLNQDIIITPHLNEFQKLTDKTFIERDEDVLREKKLRYCQNLALDLQICILLKGAEDLVVSTKGYSMLNRTGNAGMTVGGSGDTLGGFLVSLLARGVPCFEAAQCAIYLFGVCGDRLKKTRGYTFSATDLANELPFVLQKYVTF
ncbi:MAG: NAD(P)H-hydrate dehydratase [Candidatus Peregrinibacteria bacterium]|nr:NAD(P)H-hydrate dehydratase [Candidatus Peregrinibacteria bacterium]